jgi:large subunit ribosomal protein L10
MANKEATVAEIAEGFRNSNAVLLTEYRGLTVAQLKELRARSTKPSCSTKSQCSG